MLPSGSFLPLGRAYHLTPNNPLFPLHRLAGERP